MNIKKQKARQKKYKKAHNIFRNNLSKDFAKGMRPSKAFVNYVNKPIKIKKKQNEETTTVELAIPTLRQQA